MAYYDDGYIWPQEHTTYSPVAYQDPVSFSSYDAYNVSMFHEPKSIDHGDYVYNYDYDHNYDYNYDYDYDYDNDNGHNWDSYANPSINYFAHNYMEPKLLVYEPVECDTGYVSYHTQYSISYSKVDLGFNEPEFEEYDPTPYGGGYDIISVYGKPIPPSDQTCYPRSKPKPIGPGPMPMPNSESQPKTKSNPEPKPVAVPIAIPVPLVEHKPEPKPIPIATPIPLVEPKSKPEPEPEPEPKPKPKPIPIATPIPLVEPKSKPEPKLEPEPVHALVPVPDPYELKEVEEREMEKYTYPNYGYDYPWPEYDHANATGLGYDYGYGKQMVQVPPCEYNPEVVDLCESIFGSWPCLARMRKQQMLIENNNPRKTSPDIGQLNPWEECASYIFGRPITSYNV